MKFDWRQAAFVLTPALVLASWAIALASFFAWTLPRSERDALLEWLAPRVAPMLFLWVLASTVLAMAARAAWRRWVAAPQRLAEQVQALLASDAQAEVASEGGAGSRALAVVVNGLLRQRGALRSDIAEQVRVASREVERQRSRLAALMAELSQSVVVCNLDGQVLLYNNRARLQFRALSQAPAVADGAELIGLGRSIYAVLERTLVDHALEGIRRRLRRGAAHPSAQFLTSTRSGALLRVQMAPVLEATGAGHDDASPRAEPTALDGFVLMLEDVTSDFTEASQRDRLLYELAEGTRASLGTLQAAIEMLDYPDLDARTHERFLGVIRDEVRAMGARMRDLAGQSTQMQKTRWPLEEMLGADLVSAAQVRIESRHGCRVVASQVDPGIWLRVDSFSLLQALAHLAGRLVRDYPIRLLELRLLPAGPRAHLDLAWSGLALSSETVAAWETDSMGDSIADSTDAAAGPGPWSTSLSVRDVVERHGAEMWFQRERARHEAFFRFLLPLAGTQADPDATPFPRDGSRPEYYDFDLFRVSGSSRALADRELLELDYTVFDTETTGLDPSAGDRIIQIGATRIVAGKLLRQEYFEQLVDPQRGISAASTAIHGIDASMLAGQPTIEAVLPAFHAFARDTVLVAHNAAFDMRFLQLLEARTGVVFDQPVLDTLLLSAFVHPHQESHGLEAIAERLGIEASRRHDALADAIITAEVFLKLIPVLAERGVHTLEDAREAAKKTYYARLRY